MASAAATGAASSSRKTHPDWSDDSDAEAEVKNVKAYQEERDAGEEVEAIGEKRARELRAEIKLLELMLSKGTAGLLDLYVMREEIEDLKASDLEGKAGELQEGLWEVKRSIMELKEKKSRELVRWVARAEVQKLGNKGKAKGIEAEEEEEVDEKLGENEELKLNWGSILATIGAGALAAAAVFFIGQVKLGNQKKLRDKDQPRSRSSSILADI